MLLSEADIQRLRDAGHDGFVAERDGWRVLANEDGACVFLDAEGRCSVHGIRPMGCRLYPLIFDRDAGPMLDVDVCPYTEAFDVPDGAQQAVRALAGRLIGERRRRLEDG